MCNAAGSGDAVGPPVASNAATATDIPNPDAYNCSQAGKVDFESFRDGTNLSSGTIAGLHFTTTNGFTWLVGDFTTGQYNGKYPSGNYTSQGTRWAWLGETQGAGRIDFPRGPASYFSLLVSDNTPVQVDGYDAQNHLLATAGPAAVNYDTGHMTELKLTRATRDLAYVMVHDSGNYFLVDEVCTDAPGTPDTINRVVNSSTHMVTGDHLQGSFLVDVINGVQHFLHFLVGPFFSDVDLNITRPDGTIVGPNDPGVAFSKTGNWVDVTIDNAQTGQWQYEIVANELDPGGEDIALTVDDEQILVPDTSPPVTTATLDPASPDGEHGWFKSDVTVTLAAQDPDPGDGSTPSGVADTEYQVNGGGFQPYQGPFVVSAESADDKVEYYSVDGAGNVEATNSLDLMIDKTPPTVTCSANPDVLWPPDGKLMPVTTNVGVTDALSGPAGFTLDSVRSNEALAAGAITGFAPGTAATSGALQARRLGYGTGRVYSLTYTGSDQAGNTADCVVIVLVPHDQGQ